MEWKECSQRRDRKLWIQRKTKTYWVGGGNRENVLLVRFARKPQAPPPLVSREKSPYVYNTSWGGIFVFIINKYLKLNIPWRKIPIGRRRSTKHFTTTEQECITLNTLPPCSTKQKTKFVVLVVGSESPTFLSSHISSSPATDTHFTSLHLLASTFQINPICKMQLPLSNKVYSNRKLNKDWERKRV